MSNLYSAFSNDQRYTIRLSRNKYCLQIIIKSSSIDWWIKLFSFFYRYIKIEFCNKNKQILKWCMIKIVRNDVLFSNTKLYLYHSINNKTLIVGPSSRPPFSVYFPTFLFLYCGISRRVSHQSDPTLSHGESLVKILWVDFV